MAFRACLGADAVGYGMGPWLSSRKLSVEGNGFDFLGQLTLAGYLVFGACWPGLRKSFASSFDQSTKVGYLAFDVLLDRPAKESNARD